MAMCESGSKLHALFSFMLVFKGSWQKDYTRFQHYNPFYIVHFFITDKTQDPYTKDTINFNYLY